MARPPRTHWVFSKVYTGMNILNGLKSQIEFFHRDMFNVRNIPIGVNATFRNIQSGDLIINTASIPLGENGKTNMLKLSYID